MERSSAYLLFLLPCAAVAAMGIWVAPWVRSGAMLDRVLGVVVALLCATAGAWLIRFWVRRRLLEAADEAQHGVVGLTASLPGLAPLLRTLRETLGRAHVQSDALLETGAQLSAVLESMEDAVLAVDHSNRIVFANRVASQLLRLSGAGAGRHLLQAVRDHGIAQAIDECRQQNRPVRRDLTLAGDEPRQVSVCVAPQSGSAPHCGAAPSCGVVVVFHDVTEIKRLESVRRDFVTNVSHELKTPLSSIKAYAETLASGAMDDSQVRQRFVLKISEQAERLHELIIDLISLARIESGKQTFEIVPLELLPIVEACLAQCRLAAEDMEVELQVDVPESAVVLADDEGLRQMLGNLLDNAIKYAPGGAVNVSCQAEGEHCVVRVSDNGVGIPQEHLPRLFERFYRVDRARARELGGTGLGLAIVKHLAQAFDGAVGVESEVGQGTTIWIRLPAAAVEVAGR